MLKFDKEIPKTNMLKYVIVTAQMGETPASDWQSLRQ